MSHSVPVPQSEPVLAMPGDGSSATSEIEPYAALVDILRATKDIPDRGLLQTLQTVDPSGEPSAPVPESTHPVANDALTSLDSATSRAVLDLLRNSFRLADPHARTEEVLLQPAASVGAVDVSRTERARGLFQQDRQSRDSIERDSSATTNNVNECDGDTDGVASDESATLESRGLRIVAQALAMAEHCLSGTAASSHDASIRELTKLAMTRAAALLQVLRFLKNDYAPVRMRVAVSTLAQRVRSLSAFEQRLGGMSIATTTRGDDSQIDADEGLLANVLLTLLWGTFELLGDVNDRRVTLTIVPDADGGSGVSFVVAQERVSQAQHWSFCSGDTDARVLRSLGTLAASQIAHIWGGRFMAAADADAAMVSLHLPRS